MALLRRASGSLLMLCWAFALLDYLGWLNTRALAVISAWGFLLLEVGALPGKLRSLILILGAVGLGSIGWAASHGADIDLISVGGEHLGLVVLITGVSFIRLATRLHPSNGQPGFGDFLKSFVGLHFVSSVAHFSAVLMMGDQLQRQGSHGPLSYVILSRDFSLAILWSPFTAMIPLVLAQVPGADAADIYPFALMVLVLAFAVTLIEARMGRHEAIENYRGYPIRWRSTTLPLTLMATLIVLTLWLPDVSMIALVTLASMTIPLLWLLWQSGVGVTTNALASHVHKQLPNARAEVCLFLASGLVAGGVKACLSLGLIHLPINATNAWTASIAMLLIYVGSVLGVHQFALVAVVAGLLHEVTTTPILMGTAYMAAASLAMSGSPVSAMNMVLQGQFQYPARYVIRHNLPYSLTMIVLVSALLHLLAWQGIQ